MRYKYRLGALCAALLIGYMSLPVSAGEVATPDEMATVQQVVEEGMLPITGADVKDGVYEVEVDSSSSMFQIVKAELNVTEGEMRAVITLGGKGYLKLYMGTGEEAVEAAEEDYIGFVEDAEGAYTYEVPVEALDAAIECTAFSKKKEKWYDRELVFRSDSLPEGAVLSKPAVTDLKDGSYKINVTLTGGSGKATVESPAKLQVSGGTATATIVWSSSNYDYMRLGSQMYYPVNTEGNSAFEIPVTVFDGEMAVIADTTAMSTPHEVAYTLHFDSASAKRAGGNVIVIVAVAAAVVVIVALIVILARRRKTS